MKPLLSMKQVEKLLGLTNPTIYKLVRNGDLKAYKIGGSTRFKQEDIDDLLSSGSVLGTYMSGKRA